MQPFTFNTTRSIISEPGSATRMGAHALSLGMSRVIVVTDRGVLGAGLLEAPLQAMDEAGVASVVYDGVIADPPEAVVQAATRLARENRVDGVIGFGGGSSLDVAKLVAYLMVSQQPLSEIYGVGTARDGRLPLIQVPTTAGTGSEVTPIAIITTGEAEKKGVVAWQLLPDIALLDADLTLGLPAEVTAATGVDAMVHAIEAYTSRHKKNPLSDALAREALRLLAGAIRAAVFEGRKNRTARADMLLGSMLAGQAFANAPVAAVHALAYPIGGLFHVPHGLSNALVLPQVMRFNLPACAPLYAELAPIIDPALAEVPDDDRAARLIDSLDALRRELKMKVRLSEVGISHNHLPKLAEEAMKQTRLLVNNPRDVTYDDALAIYTDAA